MGLIFKDFIWELYEFKRTKTLIDRLRVDSEKIYKEELHISRSNNISTIWENSTTTDNQIHNGEMDRVTATIFNGIRITHFQNM